MAEEKVSISPEVLKWAFRRIGKHPEQANPEAPGWVRKVEQWPEDDDRPTFKKPTFTQVINFARKAHLPLDYLLRDKPPPKAKVSLPDMRAVRNGEIPEPSLELLKTIHLCQWRQEWYKDYLHSISDISCDFVGSAAPDDSAQEVATAMRDRLGLHDVSRRGSQEDKIRALTEAAEKMDVLVMRSSMFRSPHRMLKPEEFRGFSLADEVDKQAPVIFINSAAPKSTLAFTFAYEMAHIWLGVTALSGGEGDRYLSTDAKQIEQWCHRVATQFLAPTHHLTQSHHPAQALPTKLYKVSDEPTVDRYDIHKKESAETRRSHITAARIAQIYAASRLVCQAVIASVGGGDTTFLEACRLLSVRNTRALREIGDIVGVQL